MKVSKDVIYEIAKLQFTENTPTSEKMTIINDVSEMNIGEHLHSPDEISYAKFLEHVEDKHGSDIIDLLYLSENLMSAHKTFHISIKVMGEKPNDFYINLLRKVYGILLSINKVELLVDNEYDVGLLVGIINS